MATIRTKFRSSSAEGREGALYYQVIHNRVVRQISTGYKLFASEWDQRSEAVIPCQHPAGMERDNYLLSVGERIRRDKIRLEKAIRTLSQSGPFTADDIVIRFHDSGQEPSFNDMAYLKKGNIANGILTYRRKKTEQQLFIRWEKCMQEIINKYPVNKTEFLLPVITERDKEYRKQYTNALHRVNTLLKK